MNTWKKDAKALCRDFCVDYNTIVNKVESYVATHTQPRHYAHSYEYKYDIAVRFVRAMI